MTLVDNAGNFGKAARNTYDKGATSCKSIARQTESFSGKPPMKTLKTRSGRNWWLQDTIFMKHPSSKSEHWLLRELFEKQFCRNWKQTH